jgi:hypothetical protein
LNAGALSPGFSAEPASVTGLPLNVTVCAIVPPRSFQWSVFSVQSARRKVIYSEH